MDDVGANTAETPQSTTSQRLIPAPRTTLHQESRATACDDDEILFVPEAPSVSAPQSTTTTSQRPIPAPRTALHHESPTPMTTVCNDDEIQFVQAPPVPAPRAPRPVPSIVLDSPENMDDLYADDSVVDELRAQSRHRAHQETLKSVEGISNFYNRSRKRQVNSTEKLS